MPPYGHDREPGPPRNYFGIPAAPTVPPQTPFVPHDRLDPARHTGELALRIETLSDLHVGTGQYARHGGELVREPLRRSGVLAIPGASIKGSCRQVFEALTDSVGPFDEPMLRLKPDPRVPPPKLSAAAALFGTLGFQGRLSFDDAVPEAPVEARLIRLSAAYLPQHEVGRRFYGLLPPGAQQPPRIPVWAIPAGTRLVTLVRFRNASEGEIGGVLLSLGLGLHGAFVPRLGGGKYDGYGCVRFSVTGVRLRAARGFGAPTRHDAPEALREFRERCAGAFVPTAKGTEALQQLRAQLVAPPSPETRA